MRLGKITSEIKLTCPIEFLLNLVTRALKAKIRISIFIQSIFFLQPLFTMSCKLFKTFSIISSTAHGRWANLTYESPAVKLGLFPGACNQSGERSRNSIATLLTTQALEPLWHLFHQYLVNSFLCLKLNSFHDEMPDCKQC